MSRERILEGRTLSYQKIVLTVSGRTVRLRLKRHLAPRTVRLILDALPIRGNAHVSGNMTYVNTDIKSGLERGRTEFHAGDVAFLPGQRCICFVTGPYSTKKPMALIGTMEGDTDILRTVGPGDAVDIYEEIT